MAKWIGAGWRGTALDGLARREAVAALEDVVRARGQSPAVSRESVTCSQSPLGVLEVAAKQPA